MKVACTSKKSLDRVILVAFIKVSSLVSTAYYQPSYPHHLAQQRADPETKLA